MSRSLDVNLLLYASDGDSPHHDTAAEFLRDVTTDGETLYVAWITLMSYLRMATHPRIFARPLSPEEARANVESLIGLPTVRCIGEADGFWETFVEVAEDTPVRANLVPDAHLAAILKQQGVRTIYTHDRDFLKFPFLRVVDPLDG